MSTPAPRCPAAGDAGAIFGLDDLVQSIGGPNSVGILCGYRRKSDAAVPQPTTIPPPRPSHFGVSLLQAPLGATPVATVQRIADSLAASSDPIDLGISAELDVHARILRDGRAAWFVATSAHTLTFAQFQVPANETVHRDDAVHRLRSLASLLGL
jgi:hypothetical protein